MKPDPIDAAVQRAWDRTKPPRRSFHDLPAIASDDSYWRTSAEIANSQFLYALARYFERGGRA